MSHQQPGICHVALLRSVIRAKSQPYIGVRRIEAGVDYHSFIQPDERIFIGAETGIFADRGKSIFLFFFGELTENSVEDSKNLIFVSLCELRNIVPIQSQDAPLGFVGSLEVFPVQIGKDRLWHPAYQKVLAEVVHHFSVERRAKRFSCFKAMFNERYACLISHGPEELLEVHGEHFNMLLFGWNDDILNILLQADQRAGFQKVIPTIRYKIFDKLSGTGILLHFIEYNQRFPFVEHGGIERSQLCKKQIEVGAVIDKQIQDIPGCVTEIDDDVTAVLIRSELFCNKALTDTSCSVNQQSGTPVAFLLPGNKAVINLSFQHKSITPYYKYASLPIA